MVWKCHHQVHIEQKMPVLPQYFGDDSMNLASATRNNTSSRLLAGVLTGDPRLVPEAQPVPLLTFDEAAELANFGAKILHPQAMRPARINNHMAVRVKNSYNRY